MKKVVFLFPYLLCHYLCAMEVSTREIQPLMQHCVKLYDNQIDLEAQLKHSFCPSELSDSSYWDLLPNALKIHTSHFVPPNDSSMAFVLQKVSLTQSEAEDLYKKFVRAKPNNPHSLLLPIQNEMLKKAAKKHEATLLALRNEVKLSNMAAVQEYLDQEIGTLTQLEEINTKDELHRKLQWLQNEAAYYKSIIKILHKPIEREDKRNRCAIGIKNILYPAMPTKACFANYICNASMLMSLFVCSIMLSVSGRMSYHECVKAVSNNCLHYYVTGCLNNYYDARACCNELINVRCGPIQQEMDAEHFQLKAWAPFMVGLSLICTSQIMLQCMRKYCIEPKIPIKPEMIQLIDDYQDKITTLQNNIAYELRMRQSI